jgi:phosphatidylserine/phosphatidylglycerophosphate/cardiolipin synthase-like enzyme
VTNKLDFWRCSVWRTTIYTREVFVTSANLTEAALDRNIEVGLLVRDRALAASVSSHFRGLIERGVLHPLPMM